MDVEQLGGTIIEQLAGLFEVESLHRVMNLGLSGVSISGADVVAFQKLVRRVPVSDAVALLWTLTLSMVT